MPAAAIDRRLGHTRIDFSELVQLRASFAHHELWSRATNLSERGLHLQSDTVLAPGTLMELVLPLPRVEQSLELKGRVAWSRAERDPGMGIELVDLSETELSYLRREVMEGRPREWRREVKVWFEGTREPTRAIASGSGASLQLISELGFLKLGSQVVVYDGAASELAPLLGTLSEVALRRNANVPQLLLSVLPAASEAPPPPDQTWTHWPPPPVRAIAEETDAFIIEAAPASAPEVHVLESVSGSIFAEARPDPILSAEPSVEAAGATPAPREAAPGPGNPEWQLGPVPESSDWQLQSPALVLGRELPRVRRRRAWLWWLAAALMAGTTVASMSYTHSWVRVREKLLVWWSGLGQQLAASSTRFSLLPPTSLRRQIAPAPVPAPAPPGEPAAGSPTAPGPLLEVTARRLSIPIRGSIRGSRSYPLAEPAGIAINLPHATPLVGFGDFEIQRAGFRRVWVRRRGAGLHLRVFFSESYTESCTESCTPTLSVAAEQVSVQLRTEGTTPTP